MGLNTEINAAQLDESLPDLTSTIELPELDDKVEIMRDTFGIPHVTASTTHDAFYGQGFVHAQDRLWQMEFDRRRATGRWSELVGQDGLLLDTFARRTRLEASARTDYEHFNAETKAMIDAYTAGVNAFITTTDRLPVEFAIAGITPEPWETWHSSVIFKIRHILMGTGIRKLLRARVLAHLGPDAASQLRSEGYGEQILIVPPGEDYQAALKDISELDPGADAISRLTEFEAGSNNWALSGDRTASGLPLVAGDPHRALDVPNVYYQNHLACPDFDVVGFSFCGVPGFPHFGHSSQVAWCITHAGADYQDLYVEHFDPDNPARYEFQREWQDVAHSTETITVRDADDVEIDIYETLHGPIVFGDPASGAAISFRYSALVEPNSGFQALLPMLRAMSVQEFDEAMRDWVDPCNNLIIGDVHGNIGYLTRGKVPIRSRANFWLPVPGWNGQHEWEGMIPFEELPRIQNPDTGYLVTANNRIVSDDYPYLIALDYAPPSRALRIISHLDPMQHATVDDMATIHSERLSLPSSLFRTRLEAISAPNDLAQAALAELQRWDGTMEQDQIGPTIYIAIRNNLTKLVANLPSFDSLAHNPFESEVPPLVGPIGWLWWIVPRLLHDDELEFLPDGTTWNDLLASALVNAVSELSNQLGDDVNQWSWKKLHQTKPAHPLAMSQSDLAEILNPSPVSIGGDGDTPQAASIYPGVSYQVAGTSVARYIFDTNDWNNSRWIVPLGSSGHPGSEHFQDQAEKWSQVEYIPMLYDWDQIRTEADSQQTLQSTS